ncbi:lactate dehydrogenase [Salinadaptatus halalkaliphilus]|uniref:malate dehydrogenase n=1 Tax=Salinadaptatus halalkaliphilus TaxID=2419781 RepID=A0A4S3TQW9_9EURY|nr:lactate dehydrogenase [Salinadaptatus halalkaliphilus]THE64958.1 lactate dehydrogenase [Salinadaptatus halalkaliphilus]
MNVLVVGGGGTIGITTAYTLAVDRPGLDITLADPRTEVTDAHATDLRHSQCHASHAIGRPAFEDRPGTISTVDPTDEPGQAALEAADAVVVTASEPRSMDNLKRGGRLAVLERNLEIAADLGEWFGASGPTPTVVVANPSDRVTHRLWEASGWPRSSFVGYSLSETARLADELARRTDAAPDEIYCPILGEHGEHMVPVFSRATAAGEALSFSSGERQAILDYVRQVPYDVIDKRGADDSSRWVTGRGAALLVSRLLAGGTDRNDPVCLATPLDGEYGLEDVTLSVPVVLDSDGVAEILEWELTDEERRGLEDAADAIRSSLG